MGKMQSLFGVSKSNTEYGFYCSMMKLIKMRLQINIFKMMCPFQQKRNSILRQINI